MAMTKLSYYKELKKRFMKWKKQFDLDYQKTVVRSDNVISFPSDFFTINLTGYSYLFFAQTLFLFSRNQSHVLLARVIDVFFLIGGTSTLYTKSYPPTKFKIMNIARQLFNLLIPLLPAASLVYISWN